MMLVVVRFGVPALSSLVFCVVLSCSGGPCPDGFLRDNDGNCIEVPSQGAGDDDDWPSDDDDDDSQTPDDDDHITDDDDVQTDETWNDPVLGIAWQVAPTAFGVDWYEADDHCQNLIFAGSGGWRMPDIDEMRSIVRGCPATEPGGACQVSTSCTNWNDCSDDACDGCERSEGPENGFYWPDGFGCEDCENAFFWSETEGQDAGSDPFAYGIYYSSAYIGTGGKNHGFANWHVLCVSDTH